MADSTEYEVQARALLRSTLHDRLHELPETPPPDVLKVLLLLVADEEWEVTPQARATLTDREWCLFNELADKQPRRTERAALTVLEREDVALATDFTPDRAAGIICLVLLEMGMSDGVDLG